MLRHTGAGFEERDDELVVEEPLEIRVGGVALAVTMRTPGHDRELVAGFLLSEGIVKSTAELAGIGHCWDPETPELRNVVDVTRSDDAALDLEALRRNVYASSSCGLCGTVTLASVEKRCEPIEDPVEISASTLRSLPDRLRRAQTIFAKTGGLHAAALFDSAGELEVVREDIGRHNAVDKVIGYHLLRDKLPLTGRLLLVSGRASFEILQKAAMARIPVVAAVSAASSLAVSLAEQQGQTLVAFLREGSFNVYTGRQRVV
ncbi:MAG: formate dehydrogenase accessory sulfurtransferase FdhD [Planctomycetota bacterium]